jgi:MFS transporter, ACS family, hexuronate transporter
MEKLNPRANLRWTVCGLLFFATTVNYIDRQVLGLLKPTLEHEMGWTEADYGWVVFAFQCAYAVMMPVAGRIIDWLGTRVGYALAVVVWSLASMSHALAHSAVQFAAARFALGTGEAANFPAAVKTIAAWFPQRERALATGIFNSGSNVGAIVAPLMVPFFALRFGWRSAFIATGALDFVWLAAWLLFFRRHPQPEIVRTESVRYSQLFRKRQAWILLLGKFLTDPAWWFYLFWLPGFLNIKYGLDLAHLGPPLVAIYVSADLGSIGGGWLSSAFLAHGWSVNRARKTAMFVCACGALPMIGVMFTGQHLWAAVGLISLAVASHQGWSANIYTLASDMFPREAVGTATGFGSMGGAISGMLVAPVIGYWLDFSHNAYAPLFFVFGSMYLVALLVIHLIVPRVGQVEI